MLVMKCASLSKIPFPPVQLYPGSSGCAESEWRIISTLRGKDRLVGIRSLIVPTR